MIGQMAVAIALPGFNNLGRRKSINYKFSNSVLFSSSLSMRRFQMLFEGSRFVITLATFGIINATDSLIQNMTRIVCLRRFIFDIFS